MTIHVRNDFDMSVDQNRLLKESANLANRHGINGLSMNDLAEALGIRPPSLYSHVAGIDDVKRLLALHGLEILDQSLARAIMGRSGADAVVALLHAYREFAQKNPGVYAATIPTPPRSDRAWSSAVDRLMATFLASLQEYDLPGHESVHALRGLRSLVHGFVSLESTGALKHPVDRDESFGWLIESFIAALKKMSLQVRTRTAARS
jgi:AcrR family transcriptional regulator